ncbi:hypothetical protein AJ78_00988 [Emergomyces pasteurianus Ep9510]|uniref:SNARE-complex protein Syntaxin-18 N-terminal domain-containing protein n=1 Tax=Emergomyces pasteurianus Ep9510 TaxID=1447872 RepID=A0A1J9QUU3_9EURO|nr:hypothetical protein AJ78_00988 [Emergomyces pasteurianus Ep9510]
MTDITPIVNELLKISNCTAIPDKVEGRPSTETVDEFLKEAYRINTHITSLLTYLKSIRQSYLSTTTSRTHFSQSVPHAKHHHLPSTTTTLQQPPDQKQHLTDADRDTIDSSTALVLRDLSGSITNLASAETLRQETQTTLLRKKFGLDYKDSALWKWAAGGNQVEKQAGSAEQERLEETERTLKTIRENVLWWLRRRLEGVAEVQREMVEKRIERAREKEKSVLYKMSGISGGHAGGFGVADELGLSMRDRAPGGPGAPGVPDISPYVIDEKEKAEIESKLSPEQLQLFAQENDGLLKHYEDTLGKVKNAEKSLLEISSLQQTLVMHLSTQEDFINQLVSDAVKTETNVGQGNKDLKRAAERRSTAQAVFWGTVGLCTWLIIWDAIF